MMEDFETQLKKLNERQREAVDTIDGPVMVIAGPGTGKTQILTLRIANILRKTDTAPEQILALTFTESGVTNMRSRLTSIIGSDAYRITIATFHGFANSLIMRYPERFPTVIGAKAVTEVDQVALLEKIIMELDLSLLRPFGEIFLYLRSILSAINSLKREGVTSTKFSELVQKARAHHDLIPDKTHEKGAHAGKMKKIYKDRLKLIEKNEELAIVYEEYQKRLYVQKMYDFSDMIIEVVRSLSEDSDFQLELQEEYQYLLVDEHQDSNNAQNRFLELLSSFHENPNIFVVGDEKQSIFRFQGANIQNFYYFTHLYPSARLITLTHNYRSSGTILKVAEAILASREELLSQNKREERPIDVRCADTREQELYFVAHDISEQLRVGRTPEEFAIIYRNNADAFALSKILARYNVPYHIESDQDLLNDSLVKKLLIILRAVANFGDDLYLAPLLHLEIFKCDSLDVFKMIRYANLKRKVALIDIVRYPLKYTKDFVLENPESFTSLYAQLERWVRLAEQSDIEEIVETIIRESGLIHSILESESVHTQFDALNTFFDEVQMLAHSGAHRNLKDLFSYLDRIDMHNLMIKKKVYGNGLQSVKLLTAHRSKGLEFEFVYIIHANNGKWGGVRHSEILPLLPEIYDRFAVFGVANAFRDLENSSSNVFENGANSANSANSASLEDYSDPDERRLFYVALTRAKQHVTITYARFNESKELLPSEFVGDIKDELVYFESIPSKDASLRFEHIPVSQQNSVVSSEKERHRDYVVELFTKRPLSVSALNNYLKNPWQYFFKNLMRMPSARNRYQAYGNAIHGALQESFMLLNRTESFPNLETMISHFENYLAKEPLREADVRDSLEKGARSISAWRKEFSQEWSSLVKSEFRIPVVMLPWPDAPVAGFEQGIKLSGILDLIVPEDESGQTVRVIDFKTGSPRTRNEILGETKNSSGDYYRQLVFYKLLLSLWKNGAIEMTEGEIHFFEADKNKKFHREIFLIPQEDVDDLAEEIRRVAHEIVTLSFWDSPCDEKECEFCDLRISLTKNPSNIVGI